MFYPWIILAQTVTTSSTSSMTDSIQGALNAAVILLVGAAAFGIKTVIEKSVKIWETNMSKKMSRDDERHDIDMEVKNSQIVQQNTNTALLSSLVPTIEGIHQKLDRNHAELLGRVDNIPLEVLKRSQH